MTYGYEVEYAETHEAMQRSEFKRAYVLVAETSEVEANLTAAQMVGHLGIPTSTRRVK